MSKEDGGIAQRLWGWIEKFWPVSILLMAFTFLSQLEQVVKFSAYLSYALHSWRSFIHGVLEVPINTVLKVLGYPTIDIHSPLPELFAIAMLILFSNLRYNQLEDTNFAQKTVRFLIKIENYLDETKTIPKAGRGTRFAANYLEFLLRTIFGIPAFLVLYILLDRKVFYAIGLTLIIIFLSNLSKQFDKAIISYSGVLAPLIVLVSIALIIGAAGLELFLPLSEEFIQKASERAGIK